MKTSATETRCRMSAGHQAWGVGGGRVPRPTIHLTDIQQHNLILSSQEWNVRGVTMKPVHTVEGRNHRQQLGYALRMCCLLDTNCDGVHTGWLCQFRYPLINVQAGWDDKTISPSVRHTTGTGWPRPALHWLPFP